MVCRPKEYGGLGVLNTDKFACALRLQWLWYEWKAPHKPWVGFGNPCTDDDLEFFYASTIITVGDDTKTPFWESPWLLGRKSKDIAPLIFAASRRKNGKVREALKGSAWILKTNHNTVVTVGHIREFFTFWMLVHDFHLDEQAKDDIIWKHANDGIYTTATAYKAQFLGLLSPPP